MIKEDLRKSSTFSFSAEVGYPLDASLNFGLQMLAIEVGSSY